MPFLTQGSRHDCGAFCLAYLYWLDQGRTPAGGPMADDQDVVDEFYNFVQLGDSAREGENPNGCDLIRMMALLQNFHSVTFYNDPEEGVYQQDQAGNLDVGIRDQAFLDLLSIEGKVRKTAPPEPTSWSVPTTAVMACDQLDAQGTFLGRHAILFRKGLSGEILRYDPWDGLAMAVNGYNAFVSQGSHLVPIATAIMIT